MQISSSKAALLAELRLLQAIFNGVFFNKQGLAGEQTRAHPT
jgi:hypothetical protein